MAQGLRIGDTVKRFLLSPFGGRNLAVTRECMGGGHPSTFVPMVREGVLSFRSRCTAIAWDGPRLAGVASAKGRRGPRSWEIDILRLPNPEPTAASRVLELVVQKAGEHGARRIFLRVESGSDLENCARESGFFSSYQEILVEGSPRLEETPDTCDFRLTNALPHHQQGLFQLYCATCPVAVRQMAGITLTEWSDSREIAVGKHQELIAETWGKVAGWLDTTHHGGVFHNQIMAHPEFSGVMQYLVAQAHSSQGKHLWLVPDYQESLLDLLLNARFGQVAIYSMLVKSIAVNIKDRSPAALEVAR